MQKLIALRLYLLSKHLIYHKKVYFLSLSDDVHVPLVSTLILRKCKLNFILFTFIFLNWNFLLIMKLTLLKSSGYICNILMEGTMYQNYDLGPSFYFM